MTEPEEEAWTLGDFFEEAMPEESRTEETITAEDELPIVEAAPVENTAPVEEASPRWEPASTWEANPSWEASPTWESAPAWEASPREEATPVEDAVPEQNSWYQSEASAPGGEPFYSDAHYEPAGSTPTPPRYYTPPVRQERVKREKTPRRPRKTSMGLASVLCLCLVCALLGGCIGAGINTWLAEPRFAAVEEALAQNAAVSAENAVAIQENSAAVARFSAANSGGTAVSSASAQQPTVISPVAGTSGVQLEPSQIYELACSQVVGINTSYSTAGYFGGVYSGTISGSGFILSEDGYIVTNYHVIQTAAQANLPITVVLYDGTEYEASIVGSEEINDLAVLKINAVGLNPVTFGSSDALQVGEEIYVVGNPLGELEFSMSTGHVSALNRKISTEGADNISMFQLDAAVNPGNSGGPVYNSRGEVVGVVTAKYSDTDVEGLGFAIPASDALRITEDLVNLGYVSGKAYLGISYDEGYSAMFARYYNLPLGVFVAWVEPGSAAEKAGLEKGDIITALDGKSLSGYSELRSAILEHSPGDSAELSYYRAGESFTVTIVFDEYAP